MGTLVPELVLRLVKAVKFFKGIREKVRYGCKSVCW